MADEVLAMGEGAKAAAEPTRREAMVSFIMFVLSWRWVGDDVRSARDVNCEKVGELQNE